MNKMLALNEIAEMEPGPDISRPMKKLIAAVLGRAIRDLFVYDDMGVRRSAKVWFASRDTEIWSFVWCCEVIGFCPKQMRSSIKRVEECPEVLEYLTDELCRGIIRTRKQRLAA